MTWEKKPVSQARVQAFASRYGVDPLPAAIFLRRGIEDPLAVQYYLEHDLRFLHNPFLLDEMADAVQRIQQAASEGERVHVFGDRDVDGVTSTVLMTEALRNLGLEATWQVPMGDEPYGITRAVVDGCLASDVTLLIAVDCGISSVDEIQYASDHGIDTIIVDHHNPQERIPPAVALVNPKLADSSYPFDGLCACALVGKVRHALGLAGTELFNQPVCLLNVRPGNESLIMDAVKLENLVEIDRISENLVPGVLDVEHSRLGAFLAGMEILVYDRSSQERLLREAFGPKVEIGVIDVSPELWKSFPTLSGKSLLRLRTASRMAKYTGDDPSEIDVFASLFTLYISRREEAVTRDLESTLDLVALATLADMMPLENENRLLVRHGLDRMSASPRPGLRALLERRKLLGRPVSASDVGWTLSPVVNSAGRMGEPDLAVKLFLTDDPRERDSLADRVIALNEQRRQVGEQSWDLVQAQARDSLDAHAGRFILVHHRDIHRGVTGLLAGRLARQFDAPAAVVSLLADKAVGSIRTARGLVATELLARCDDLFHDWGGHDAAGGFNLPLDRIEELERRLLELLPQIELDESGVAPVEVDAELTRDHLNESLLRVVDLFAPYGVGNPPLVFLARSLTVMDIQFMGRGNSHLRLTLDAGATKWPAVYWSAADKVGAEFTRGDRVEAVFNLDMNHYNGSATPRMTIVDLRRERPE